MPKISLRSCIYCRTIRPKNQMIRITTIAQNQAVVDDTQKLGGRGAYVCNQECLKKLAHEQPQNLNRAFHQRVTPPVVI